MLPLLYSVVSQTFVLEPQTSTVLQGSDARFNATVQGEWAFMTWSINDLLVLTVQFADNNVTVEQYFARFCSNDKSCVEFTIHNVTRSESGSVICTVQGEFGSKTAQLIVQGEFTNSCQAEGIYVWWRSVWCFKFLEISCPLTSLSCIHQHHWNPL